MMNERNAKCCYPSAFLAVDETLHPYRGHIGFKQYNRNKPQSMGCFNVAYVMHLFRIPIIHCPMLKSLKIFLVMHQDIASREPMSTGST